MELEGIIAQLVPGPAQFGLSDIKYLSPLDFILKRSLCGFVCLVCAQCAYVHRGRPRVLVSRTCPFDFSQTESLSGLDAQ